MNITNAWLRTADGQVCQSLVNIRHEQVGQVTAVYLDGICNCKLDADFGAGIDFEVPELASWMADFRHSEFWCMPAFGQKLDTVPQETQGFLYQKQDGSFGAILPVVSQQYKCVLQGKDEKTLTAKLFSWYGELTRCCCLAFLYAQGSDPAQLMELCAEVGLQLLGQGVRTRKQRRYPELFEYLGWCSWDAFQIRVTEQDLLDKCREFRDKQIPVKWAIIDDMWAHVRDFYDRPYDTRIQMFDLMHHSRLYDFQADPIRFPKGLKHCIGEMESLGITVGMWHPTTGYWMGIDPDGPLYEKQKENLLQAPNGSFVPSYERDKAFRYYSALHDYLRSCGAQFIKIDNQTMTRRFYKGLAPVGQAARQFHDAMEASVGAHFDNQMINCMGMGSEDMWNRSVSPISRCSDDFLPEDSAWFTKHILQCAYNCLVQGSFYHCDWDMWWTDDGQAVKNSVLRAVSGGPIYVSDQLHRSRREVLMPLVLADGRILRCDRPAVPTADCITADPTENGRIFKVQNICGSSGVVAVFDLDAQDGPVTGTLSPRDVPGLEGEEFAVYEHFSKTLHILKKDEALSVSLKDRSEFKLYVIVPVTDGFAAIGRTDKFISPKTVKAVRDREVELTEPGPYATAEDGKLILHP